jgi:hypothetical protein
MNGITRRGKFVPEPQASGIRPAGGANEFYEPRFDVSSAPKVSFKEQEFVAVPKSPACDLAHHLQERFLSFITVSGDNTAT